MTENEYKYYKEHPIYKNKMKENFKMPVPQRKPEYNNHYALDIETLKYNEAVHKFNKQHKKKEPIKFSKLLLIAIIISILSLTIIAIGMNTPEELIYKINNIRDAINSLYT